MLLEELYIKICVGNLSEEFNPGLQCTIWTATVHETPNLEFRWYYTD